MGLTLFISVFIPIVVGVILKIYFHGLLKDEHDLVIGVLSARSHFKQRSVIRDTWWKQGFHKNSTIYERVGLRFVIGDKACQYPVTDRTEETACSFWNVSDPEKSENLQLVHWVVSQGKTSPCRTVLQYEVSFKVLHPVIVTRLGVLAALLIGGTSVQVSLMDLLSQIEVVNTVIGYEDSDALVLYKSIQSYLLPKGFEGLIRVSGLASHQDYLVLPNVQCQLNQSPVLLTHEDWSVQDAAGCQGNAPVVSMIYAIHDLKELSSHVKQRGIRQRNYEDQTQHENELLLKEQKKYGDLLMVNGIDVYRNLAEKLLHFFRWVLSEEFSFVLKTDDDCYVDVERILHVLQKWRGRTKVWWGRFRHNWAVNEYGKWSERQYRSTVYPDFACGSGYVLSKDLVEWLVENQQHLHHYQGEDVSLGIWLAAVRPHYINDPLWQCEAECISDMYSCPNLPPHTLRDYWMNRQNCTDPCGCS